MVLGVCWRQVPDHHPLLRSCSRHRPRDPQGLFVCAYFICMCMHRVSLYVLEFIGINASACAHACRFMRYTVSACVHHGMGMRHVSCTIRRGCTASYVCMPVSDLRLLMPRRNPFVHHFAQLARIQLTDESSHTHTRTANTHPRFKDLHVYTRAHDEHESGLRTSMRMQIT
jgi:hypothetical protein